MYYFNQLLLRDGKDLIHLDCVDGSNVDARYNYWIEMLSQRASRLFTWSGLPKNLPAFEIEQRFIMQGFCIFSEIPTGKLDVFYGTGSDFTGVYFDIPMMVNYWSPTHSGTLYPTDFKTHDKNCVFARNSAFLTPILPIIEYYAMMLAHTDCSFITSLIHDRLKGGVPTAGTKKSVDLLNAFYKKLKHGRVGALQDSGFATTKWQPVDLKNNTPLNMYTEVQGELISRFYNDIGVKTARKKKGNMIAEEVDSDTTMLLVNISEMLEQRQAAVKELNEFYGTNISVDISDEIKRVMQLDDYKEEDTNVDSKTDMR